MPTLERPATRPAHAPTPAETRRRMEAIPDAPPANMPIPPQQTFLAAEDEKVRARAYELWEAAGCPACDGQEFWFRAERELAAR